MELDVFLHETPVARLARGDDGLVRLRFLTSYVEAIRRPVLGLYYLDKLRAPHDPEPWVPAFFANLLPDPNGQLRRLVVVAAGIREDQEMRLLARLGDDLPGAVKIRATSEDEDEAPYPPPARAVHIDGARLRFSLAGVQLKFSMVREGRGLTLPASGRGGDWLVKLPDLEYMGVPEAEYATMTWARASGLDVPEVDLVTYAQLSGIPDPRGRTDDAALCFAVRRFDRLTGGGRVHIEDFAQVFGRSPHHKYNEDLPRNTRLLSFEILARAVRAYAPEDRREFVRRLVFMVLSGNADAHLKNWSFIYRDGRTPRLSPAYDLVPTIVYPRTSGQLALPWFGAHEFTSVTLDSFARLQKALQVGPEELRRWAVEDVERVMDAWAGLSGAGLELRYAIDQHHARLRRAGLLKH